MKTKHDLIPPQPLESGEPLDNAVYCAECEYLEQEIIGSKNGKCFGHQIQDSNRPIVCQYHKNAHRLISVVIFLKSGICVYNKAIVKDLAKEIDPGLLSSFLQAISAFGKEIMSEQISLIRFQKMNIVFCRGLYINGAMMIKGKVKEEAKKMFSYFLQNLEDSFKDYFSGEFNGRVLPEKEVDKIAFKSMKAYVKEHFYSISPSLFKKSSNQICGIHL